MCTSCFSKPQGTLSKTKPPQQSLWLFGLKEFWPVPSVMRDGETELPAKSLATCRSDEDPKALTLWVLTPWVFAQGSSSNDPAENASNQSNDNYTGWSRARGCKQIVLLFRCQTDVKPEERGAGFRLCRVFFWFPVWIQNEMLSSRRLGLESQNCWSERLSFLPFCSVTKTTIQERDTRLQFLPLLLQHVFVSIDMSSPSSVTCSLCS